MFKNLRELVTSMPTEEQCRQYLIEQRWGGCITCPYCGFDKKIYVIENGKRFKCSDCLKKFSVTVGTVMEASKIPLTKWFMGAYLVSAHKKGISSYQLGRDLGIAQKNAWFMLHRIREAFRVKGNVELGEKQDAIIEADETFVGGKYSNMHTKKRKKLLEDTSRGQGLANKTTVLGMIERGGNMVAKVVPPKDAGALSIAVAETVKGGCTLVTDSTSLYGRITHHYNYLSVNHSIQEYVRDNAHTNTIEGAFSHFKRMVYGIYHQISAKHTQRYCDEFVYRFNSRKIKDCDRFNLVIGAVEGRLTYKRLIASPQPKEIVIVPSKVSRGYGIIQLKDGEIVGQYLTLRDAQKQSGVDRSSIRKACKGEYKHAGGFQWIYA